MTEVKAPRVQTTKRNIVKGIIAIAIIIAAIAVIGVYFTWSGLINKPPKRDRITDLEQAVGRLQANTRIIITGTNDKGQPAQQEVKINDAVYNIGNKLGEVLKQLEELQELK